jgi:hypothetical protein
MIHTVIDNLIQKHLEHEIQAITQNKQKQLEIKLNIIHKLQPQILVQYPIYHDNTFHNIIVNQLIEKRKIKHITANNYLRHFTNFFKKTFQIQFIDDLNRMQDFKISEKSIYHNFKSTHTQKTIVNAIVIILIVFDFQSKIISKYAKLHQTLVRKTLQEHTTNIQHTISIQNIEFLRNYWKHKFELISLNNTNLQNHIDIQYYLIFLLYTDIKPLRNDFVDTKILIDHNSQDTTFNYIDLDKQIFILNNYKTDQTQGQKIIKLTTNIIQVLQIWMQFNHTEFILVLPKNMKPMNPTNLTKYLYNVFKPLQLKFNVSTTILRKSYITTNYPIDHTLERNKIQDADDMCHSVSTATKYYNQS